MRKLCMKNISHADDVTENIIEWWQNRPSIFMFKWNWHTSRDNSKTIRGIIIKCYVQMCHCCIIMPLENIVSCFVDGVTMFENGSKFWTAISSLISKLGSQSWVQNIRLSRGYLCYIFRFQCHFRVKSSLHLKMATILKIQQFSRQSQFECISINFLMRRKNDVLFMQLSQKLTEQRRCKII